MQMRELAGALRQLSAISQRHGAIGEAEALIALAQLAEPYSEKTVAQFVSLAQAPRHRKQPSKQNRRR